jgi:hypothetical protein
MNPGDSDKRMVWIYPDQEPAPRGVKIALLTIGNIEVTGNWTDDGRYKAWQRLFSRDKEHERLLREVAARRASPKHTTMIKTVKEVRRSLVGNSDNY